jgi:hypothetical protein
LLHEPDVLRLNNLIDFVVNGYLESSRLRGIVQYGQSGLLSTSAIYGGMRLVDRV